VQTFIYYRVSPRDGLFLKLAVRRFHARHARTSLTRRRSSSSG
jgi:hypothetical protein